MFSKPVVLNTLTTLPLEAHAATCSAPEVMWPTARPDRSSFRGLVQSRMTFPLKSPACRTASWVAAHGVANATTSPCAAASATSPALALPPVALTSSSILGAVGSGTPNTTSCPFCTQDRPRVPPTFPAPMTPMRMAASDSFRLFGELDPGRLVMFHLLDLFEKRGDEGQEALERRTAQEVLQVPVHRVPPDQQQVAAAVLEAPGQLVAQAVRRVGKVLLRLPVSVLEGCFLVF